MRSRNFALIPGTPERQNKNVNVSAVVGFFVQCQCGIRTLAYFSRDYHTTPTASAELQETTPHFLFLSHSFPLVRCIQYHDSCLFVWNICTRVYCVLNVWRYSLFTFRRCECVQERNKKTILSWDPRQLCINRGRPTWKKNSMGLH